MAEQLMETTLRTALWQQFGAAIDMLENALLACPSMHWNGLLWSDPQAPAYPTFWSITYHTLFWLEAYLSGSLEDYAPPAPFALDEGDRAATRAEPYTKEQLRGWLAAMRQQARTTLTALTDEQARQPFVFPWRPGHPISYLALQLYNMRHAQEHAAHLSLMLGQHGLPPADLDWVSYAGEQSGG